ncbi:MAG: HlyD family efflux transporter periplasmic adaptor subunit [Ruminiclostridium sp.]|nr:HlyD family efflux transporter periplasmic adaptor subunit [Ruminiclostridium sp.]
MKKTLSVLALLLAAVLTGGCSKAAEKAEIKIPILDGSENGSFKTAEVKRQDVEEFRTIGADVEYVYAEDLPVPYDTNVIEYKIHKGDRLNAGDVIAEFDPSGFDYDIQNQKILADSAYAKWQSSGSELSRIEYEEEKKQLELIRHKADLCTVTAPYDCVICDVKPKKAGETVSAGDMICKIAKPDEVYVTVKDNKELFAFGMPVTLKFGTNSTFSGKVAMIPDTSRGGINKVVIKLDDGELERANEEAGSIVTAGWGSVIITDYRDYDVLCVPEKAVLTYSGETYCYIEDHGERVRVPVEAGRTVGGQTVILSGLSEGDTVSY